jgi:hypothetical protein
MLTARKTRQWDWLLSRCSGPPARGSGRPRASRHNEIDGLVGEPWGSMLQTTVVVDWSGASLVALLHRYGVSSTWEKI